MDNKQNSKKESPLKNAIQLSGIGIQMGVIIGIGCFSGVKLDQRYPNDYNLFTIIFSLVSIIIAIVFVIRRVS
jgi:F0F1-type ATP synthase assembly protein I